MQVGDRVVIKEDLVTDEDYGVDIFLSDMLIYRGQTTTIKNIINKGEQYEWFSLEIDDGIWSWTKEMFDKVTE